MVDCPICLMPFTGQGGHQISCLPCGHLFGVDCIHKWLKCKKFCPQCKQTAKPKDVRQLFVPSIQVHNNSRELSLQAKLDQERARRIMAEKNHARVLVSVQMLKAQVAKLQSLIPPHRLPNSFATPPGRPHMSANPQRGGFPPERPPTNSIRQPTNTFRQPTNNIQPSQTSIPPTQTSSPHPAIQSCSGLPSVSVRRNPAAQSSTVSQNQQQTSIVTRPSQQMRAPQSTTAEQQKRAHEQLMLAKQRLAKSQRNARQRAVLAKRSNANASNASTPNPMNSSASNSPISRASNASAPNARIPSASNFATPNANQPSAQQPLQNLTNLQEQHGNLSRSHIEHSTSGITRGVNGQSLLQPPPQVQTPVCQATTTRMSTFALPDNKPISSCDPPAPPPNAAPVPRQATIMPTDHRIESPRHNTQTNKTGKRVAVHPTLMNPHKQKKKKRFLMDPLEDESAGAEKYPLKTVGAHGP